MMLYVSLGFHISITANAWIRNDDFFTWRAFFRPFHLMSFLKKIVWVRLRITKPGGKLAYVASTRSVFRWNLNCNCFAWIAAIVEELMENFEKCQFAAFKLRKESVGATICSKIIHLDANEYRHRQQIFHLNFSQNASIAMCQVKLSAAWQQTHGSEPMRASKWFATQLSRHLQRTISMKINPTDLSVNENTRAKLDGPSLVIWPWQKFHNALQMECKWFEQFNS